MRVLIIFLNICLFLGIFNNVFSNDYNVSDIETIKNNTDNTNKENKIDDQDQKINKDKNTEIIGIKPKQNEDIDNQDQEQLQKDNNDGYIVNDSSWIKGNQSKNENDLLEILNKKKEELKKILEKSEAEKQIEEEQRKKRLLEIQKEIIKELNQSLEKEIEWIKQTLNKNKSIINELKKEKIKNVSLEEKIKKLLKENDEYQKKIEILKKTIDNNNRKIYNLQVALNNQDILLNKAVELKTELENQKKEQFIRKIKQILLAGWILLLLYFLLAIIEYFYIKKSLLKKKEIVDALLSKLTWIRTIISLIFVIYFIISLFYVFPQYIFILFFTLSAVLIITGPIIWSYISTILLVWKINIGDRIIFPKTKKLDWIVTNIGLLNLEIRRIVDNRITDEFINIATRQLFLEPYVHVPHFVDFKSIKLWKIKEWMIIEDKWLQTINIATKLRNEYLSKFIEEVKQILNKYVIDRIDDKHHHLMELKIKDVDTINIDIKIKADLDTTNKIRLKIFNIMSKYEKLQEEANKKEEDEK